MMTRPTSKNRPMLALNDYQVLKGNCEKTMLPFGQPVSALHEAQLMISDDRRKMIPGAAAIYAIHQRSENRITEIVEHRKVAVLRARPQQKASMFPFLKAA